MSEAIKRRRGTTAEHAAFTGLEGEITVDTTKKTVVVHDGITPGGVPLARADELGGSSADEITYDGTASGLAATNVQGAIDEVDGSLMRSATPFGLGGMRVLRGLENDAHYGLNSSVLDAGNGKWVIVYRKASNHTVVDGAEIRAVDTYDKGATLENDRLIYTIASADTRNFVARVMGNGRLGILASRRQANLTYIDPIFIYSDNGGVTWSSQAIPANSAGQAVNFHAYMIDYPASVGGHDTNGFISYSFGSASPNGNVDALYTTNNGATWSWGINAATTASTMTEVSVSRVGTQNKWIMLGRPSGTTGAPGEAWVTNNPLNFGTSGSAGISVVGNPPLTLYDEETNLMWYMVFFRRERGLGVTTLDPGLENVLAVCAADADALYAAGGNMAAVGASLKVAAWLPDWATGYMHPSKIDGKWYATFVCGEHYPEHDYSKLCLIGDFVPTAIDNSNFAKMHTWDLIGSRAVLRHDLMVGYGATLPSTTGFITSNVASTKPGIVTEVLSASSRTHYAIRNTNGQVGSITSSGTGSAFNTTSDGDLKPEASRVDLAEEMDVGALIDALRPVAHDWLNALGEPVEGRGYGLIAQDLHGLIPHAVSPGRGCPGDADFVPWSVDYSKLVVFLLAELQALRRRVSMIERMADVPADGLGGRAT